ncbi:MAG: hypothetical protein ACJ8F7_15775 [Gemmataceae bacterium]
MPTTTFLFGVLLIVYGVYLFFTQDSDPKSPTALIPALFGAVLAVLGLVASWKESLRKHAMHAAAAAGLGGCIGGLARGLPKLKIFTGVDPAHPKAVQGQIWFGALCGVFVLLCVKSFIDARAARKQNPPA